MRSSEQPASFTVTVSGSTEDRPIQGQVTHHPSGESAAFLGLAQLERFFRAHLETPAPTEGPPPAPGSGAAGPLFRFLQPHAAAEPGPAAEEPARDSAAPAPPAPPEATAARAALTTLGAAPAADTYLAAGLRAMVAHLASYLPPPDDPALPAGRISVVGATERSAGLNRRVGQEERGLTPPAEWRGIRIEAVVRCQLWQSSATAVESALTDFSARLLADRQAMRRLDVPGHPDWQASIYQLALADRGTASEDSNGWRQHGDFRLLYELRYTDSDGVESLIAAIPVSSDLEKPEAERDTSVVRDEIIRWDNLAGGTLVVRGPKRLSQLWLLAYLPAMPTTTVTIRRTFAGASGAPAEHPTLAAFLAAVSGPAPQRHAQATFSLQSFIDALLPGGGPLPLGDWEEDGVPDDYETRTRQLTPALALPDARDYLEISSAAFDQAGVVYLRVV